MSTEREFFAALLDPGRMPPDGLTTWNGSDPARRFAVYRNNVVASLIDALADTHPVTQQLVGEDFFRAMARLYVDASPPRSRVLAFYGERLPEFIAGFAPAAGVPYLADVARLEMLRVRAYHAGDATPLTAAAVARFLAEPDALPALRIRLHASVGLLRSAYAVVALWAAHQGIGDIAQVDPDAAENALVIRRNLDVEVLRLDAADGAFVDRLLQGASLGAAMAQASTESADFDPAGILSLLIQSQLITSIHS